MYERDLTKSEIIAQIEREARIDELECFKYQHKRCNDWQNCLEARIKELEKK